MRYIDSGRREPDQALGSWLGRIEDVVALRIQSGFFRSNALAILRPVLEVLQQGDLLTHVLIGSNNRETPAPDVRELLEVVGVPRPGAQVGVVCYSGAFFHPKVFHFRRRDGSQAAYVGSANLTGSGITATHVEAGLILDTNAGDPSRMLDEIANAVDSWFQEGREGLDVLEGLDDVERLVDDAVLCRERPERVTPTEGGGGGGGAARPRLRPLIRLPGVESDTAGTAPEGTEDRRPPHMQPAAPWAGYPDFILFAPNANTPTEGTQALTGRPLPGGAEGLIVQLSQDSAKHFYGGEGSSYISLPVQVIHTIRFGVYRRQYLRPRAEFHLEMRVLGDRGEIRIGQAETNIMVYGVAAGERGHEDRRMLLPADTKALVTELTEAAWTTPGPDGFALLEWPSEDSPSFLLSFLEPGSDLARRAKAAYEAAERNGELMGRGACLLPPGFAPPW